MPGTQKALNKCSGNKQAEPENAKTRLGVREGESEAEKDRLRESGRWQFLAEPQMPSLGTTWIYLPPRNTPHPQDSGSPTQVGS